ncbi:uncharacterized protein KY384_005693 [Bacidia gigantensis]|uniref:uncharacterized protein n=1 Tax=Bacidia gigantensis TaxID=2732470 RepID=UPI001D036000|nr:uncharacterized protein KY384_005693 [Bacidia gigantensis]KAG8529058.1 hypothetical protein KY384_005693 [Bacidia gigantensis]
MKQLKPVIKSAEYVENSDSEEVEHTTRRDHEKPRQANDLKAKSTRTTKSFNRASQGPGGRQDQRTSGSDTTKSDSRATQETPITSRSLGDSSVRGESDASTSSEVESPLHHKTIQARLQNHSAPKHSLSVKPPSGRASLEASVSSDEQLGNEASSDEEEAQRGRSETESNSSETGSDKSPPISSRSPSHAARQMVAFAPPPSFEPADIASRPPSKLESAFSSAQLDGRQIWHITAPSSVPFSALKGITTRNITDGSSVLSHAGNDHGLVPRLDTDATGSDILLVASTEANEYVHVKIPISNTLNLQRVVKLPSHVPNQHDQADQNIATIRKSTKPKNEQPEGLRMRYQAFGIPSASPSGSESRHVRPVTQKPQFKIPKPTEQEVQKKRKHAVTQSPSNEPGTTPSAKKAKAVAMDDDHDLLKINRSPETTLDSIKIKSAKKERRREKAKRKAEDDQNKLLQPFNVPRSISSDLQGLRKAEVIDDLQAVDEGIHIEDAVTNVTEDMDIDEDRANEALTNHKDADHSPKFDFEQDLADEPFVNDVSYASLKQSSPLNISQDANHVKSETREERRQRKEEKRRRKEERRSVRALQHTDAEKPSFDAVEEAIKRLPPSKSTSPKVKAPVDEDDELEYEPIAPSPPQVRSPSNSPEASQPTHKAADEVEEKARLKEEKRQRKEERRRLKEVKRAAKRETVAEEAEHKGTSLSKPELTTVIPAKTNTSAAVAAPKSTQKEEKRPHRPVETLKPSPVTKAEDKIRPSTEKDRSSSKPAAKLPSQAQSNVKNPSHGIDATINEAKAEHTPPITKKRKRQTIARPELMEPVTPAVDDADSAISKPNPITKDSDKPKPKKTKTINHPPAPRSSSPQPKSSSPPISAPRRTSDPKPTPLPSSAQPPSSTNPSKKTPKPPKPSESKAPSKAPSTAPPKLEPEKKKSATKKRNTSTNKPPSSSLATSAPPKQSPLQRHVHGRFVQEEQHGFVRGTAEGREKAGQ